MTTFFSNRDIENSTDSKHGMLKKHHKESDFSYSTKSNKISNKKIAGSFMIMTKAERASLFADIQRKKKQAQIIFYDYVADTQDFLSIEFLKNPFMDFETLERLNDENEALKKNGLAPKKHELERTVLHDQTHDMKNPLEDFKNGGKEKKEPNKMRDSIKLLLDEWDET